MHKEYFSPRSLGKQGLSPTSAVCWLLSAHDAACIVTASCPDRNDYDDGRLDNGAKLQFPDCLG